MKKMKKILAILLAAIMVMGMAVTASAKMPESSDDANAVVTNVEVGATVTAYQIIEGDYGSNGFLGYKEVAGIADTEYDLYTNTDGSIYLKNESDLPTSDEVTKIADAINGGLALNKVDLVGKALTEAEIEEGIKVTSYSADLTAGYWIVLVRGTVNVYNPMLVGVYYQVNESGDDNSLIIRPDGKPDEDDYAVNATEDWTLTTDGAYAKSSTIPFEKTANVQTQDAGGEVVYTIKTTIPDYSKEYENAKFSIKDKLTNLELVEDSIEVSIDGTKVEDSNGIYTIPTETLNKETFTLNFESDWLLAREDDGETAKNAGKAIEITYKAILQDEAINEVAGTNMAELTYTNNPGEDDGYDKDIEKVYSFDIDGEVTKQIITKVKEGETEGTTAPLAGATFQIYTDAACTEVYNNTAENDKLDADNVDGVVSDADGQLHISGLNVGTYYLKEIKAPAGYSLNDTIYKIVVDAEIDEETDELESWSVVVTPMIKVDGTYTEQVNDAKTNTFTVSKENDQNSVNGTINETPVMNIRLIALPSTGGIGTTIFTVVGCAIMIAAVVLLLANRRKETK